MRELRKQDSMEAGAQVPEDSAGSPKISEHLADMIMVSTETIKLRARCLFGTPQPQCIWSKDADRRCEGDRSEMKVWPSGDVRLKIKDARVKDAGKYRLVVDNEKGSDHTECRIRVIDITKAHEYLARNRVAVMKTMFLKEVLPYLKQGKVLTTEEEERVLHNVTTGEKIDALIDHLLRRKKCSDIRHFLKGLRNTQQAHVIEKIFPESESNRRIESPQTSVETISLTGVVLKKSAEILESATGLPYFNVVVADQDKCQHVRIYQPIKYDYIKEGTTVKILGLLKKGTGGWAIGSSIVAFPREREIPKSTNIKVPELPEYVPLKGIERKLAESLFHDETRNIIKGRIVQVGHVEYHKEGTLAVRKLAVKDESGVARVVLFGDEVERRKFKRNDVIEVDGLYPSTYNDKPQLSASKISTFRILDDSECSAAITARDVLSDDEFQEDSHTEDVTIDSFTWIRTYQRCVKQGCAKMIRYGSCPKCFGTESRLTFFGQFLYTTANDENTAKITLFSEVMQRLFACDEFHDVEKLRESVRQKLGVKFNCIIKDDKFTRISEVVTGI